MAKQLQPKRAPAPTPEDAPLQYRAFAYLTHICNWSRSDAYRACFPNSKSSGQSLNNIASAMGRREAITSVVEEIDLYGARDYIDALIARNEKVTGSHTFAKPKPISTNQENQGSPEQQELELLAMTDDELMDNATRLYQAATSADEQLAAMKLIVDLKKKLGTGVETESENHFTNFYMPVACTNCQLYTLAQQGQGL